MQAAHSSFRRSTRFVFATIALFATLHAQQVYVQAPSRFPTGGNNNSFTDAIDFADVDLDGDLDALCADGGDSGLDQNRLWLNQGGAQGGTIGFFADATAARCPSVLDSSRDIELTDVDLDGDFDVYVSNTSPVSNQASRWWINMGGAQGGSLGFFQDQTQARWVGLSVAPTSVAASLVLPSGGFIDYACDCDFGDLDNDGDPDLVHSSYGQNSNGQVPTRLFLNDGGSFHEFNPSGFRLSGTSIADGNPGLWCDGAQQANTQNTSGAQCDVAEMVLDVDVDDFDGDFDLDLLLGGLGNSRPRVFLNRLAQGGALAFRDVTATSMPSNLSGGYDQDVADCDNDGDLDLYGMNWFSDFSDSIATNNGAAVFGGAFALPNSNSDDNDADFCDYDGDGDVDTFVSGFGGEDQLYRNNFVSSGALTFSEVTTSAMPQLFTSALDVEAVDLDFDGDPEVALATFGADLLLDNVLNVADTHAPRCSQLEQAANRAAGSAPTIVRVNVYDNHAIDEMWAAHDVDLEYRVVPGAFSVVDMHVSHGQIWRGAIPGNLVGTIEYRVSAADRYGNTGVSITRSFVATCGGSVTYCTAGTTANGCTATLSSSGAPSATAPSGFVITASGVEGQKLGLIFYGVDGRNSSLWAVGGTSYMCVKTPVQRTALVNSGGTAGACDGALPLDWNAFVSSNPGALGVPFAAGELVNAQAWFRDPPSPKTTSLSNAIEFLLCP